MKQQPTNDLKTILSGNGTKTEITETENEAPSKRNPKRQGKKAVMTFVEKNFHKQLKLLSLDKDINMEDLVREALQLYLEMHQRKPL